LPALEPILEQIGSLTERIPDPLGHCRSLLLRHAIIVRSALTNSAFSWKFAFTILHRSTPECHSGRGIRLQGPMRQIRYVVVSNKNAKSCMRSGEAPAPERTRLQANFRRAHSLYLRGVWLCQVLGEDESRQNGTPRPAPAWYALVTLRYCLTTP
jgi:hypothetical protein